MKYLKNLKTSDRISLIFSLFNFLSLVILLVSINIIYFFIWYSDQEKESLYDMNVNYNSYTNWMDSDNKEAFKKYILQKDTIILPENWWETICSPWVTKKVHSEIENLKNKFFYRSEDKNYFIFSNYYEWIWEVKVLFDTTPYIKSQLIIIKISFLIMFLWWFMYFFIWKKISRYALKDLEKISEEAKNLNIDNFHKIEVCSTGKNDEIRVLANALNNSFEKIKTQTQNLKQFITDVSHEFKTPLMVINSKIDLFTKKQEKEKLEKEDLEILLKWIKQDTKKLNKLLETLFLLSRITEWIEDFKKEKTNLSQYLEEFTSNLLKNFNSKSIKVNYKIEKDIFKSIETSTFNIIVENLLTNAIKFSKKDLKLEIWLDKKSFYIKDNWAWISQDIQEKIWEKFYRNDLNIEWFWVWLFIVKRIIDIYNWKIELESEVWKWSKFIIKF